MIATIDIDGMDSDVVYLAAEEDEVGVGIVEREHDAVGRVQLDHDYRVVQVAGGPEGVLSFAMLGEPRREH